MSSKECKERRVRKGMCVNGFWGLLKTKTKCAECVAKEKERPRARVAAGLCRSGCGRPLKTKCAECVANELARQRAYVAAGLCRSGCGRPLKTKCAVCAAKECERQRAYVGSRLVPKGVRSSAEDKVLLR